MRMLCPYPSCESEIDVRVIGRNRPATFWNPQEYAELEIEAPCGHVDMPDWRRYEGAVWDAVAEEEEGARCAAAEAKLDMRRERGW